VSDRLPSLGADEVIRVLKKVGFEVTRIKGSHTSCGIAMIQVVAQWCLSTRARTSSADYSGLSGNVE
jgi:hypothetical protein